MSHQANGRHRAGRGTRTILALLVGALALGIPGVAQAAKGKSKKGAKVTVMTRNVYLGADLTPGLMATDLNELVDGAGEVVNQVDRTDFPLRAKALGAEIKQRKPDLVGLQEVALWRTQPVQFAVNPRTAKTVEYDFLQSLLDEVNAGVKCTKPKKAGKSLRRSCSPKYQAVVANEEFDFEVPVNDLPPSPAGLFGADRDARLTMRDVILVRGGSGVKTSKPAQGTFPTLLRVEVGGAASVDVTRGWTAVNATVRGSKPFRFVNLHHEAFDSATSNPTNLGTTVGQGKVREAQAKSLIAPGGPATGKLPVVLVGDLNSDDDTVGNDGDVLAYNALVAGGFRPVDTSNPMSCCISDSDLAGGSVADFDHHIDHVMSDDKRVKFLRGFVTGRALLNGLWPSDHAGVTSVLRMQSREHKNKK